MDGAGWTKRAASTQEGRLGAPVMLIADDERQVRAVVTEMAERLGWATICASDGGEALDLLSQFSGRLSLMLIDLEMPVLDGLRLLGLARAAYPGIPAVLTSGAPEERVIGLAAENGAVAILPKPFGMEELAVLLKARQVNAPALESLRELALG